MYRSFVKSVGTHGSCVHVESCKQPGVASLDTGRTSRASLHTLHQFLFDSYLCLLRFLHRGGVESGFVELATAVIGRYGECLFVCRGHFKHCVDHYGLYN